MTSTIEIAVGAATDPGLKRRHNEDSHGVWVSEDSEERRRRGVLIVVADGMGGSSAGEIASRLAVETVVSAYRAGSAADPLDDLHRAVERANQVVHAESSANPDLIGMGTTCTAIVVRKTDVFLAQVGDTRAYLVGAGRIRQLSNDHSLVAQLVREGHMKPEQAKVDPRRNVVTRSVGVGARVEIDVERFPGLLDVGDTLLLCSDGLHGPLDDEELAELASRDDLGAACREAIALANQRGGPDNITIVLARARAAGEPAPREAPTVEPPDALPEPERRIEDTHAGYEPANRRTVDSPSRTREVWVETGEGSLALEAPFQETPARRAERARSRSRLLMGLLAVLLVLLVVLIALALGLRRGEDAPRDLGRREAGARMASERA